MLSIKELRDRGLISKNHYCYSEITPQLLMKNCINPRNINYVRKALKYGWIEVKTYVGLKLPGNKVRHVKLFDINDIKEHLK